MPQLPEEYKQRYEYGPSILDQAPESCFHTSIFSEVKPRYRRRHACISNRTHGTTNTSGKDNGSVPQEKSSRAEESEAAEESEEEVKGLLQNESSKRRKNNNFHYEKLRNYQQS